MLDLNNEESLLQVTDLKHKYGNRLVLSVTEWVLRSQEHQLLRGPSGSGKTTLLGILSGMLNPTQGTVEALGASLTDMSVSELSFFRAQNYGFVFQDHHLVSSLSVWDNLTLACHLAQLPEDPNWNNHLLDHLGLEEYKHSKPTNLSQGEAQRAAIARAAVTKPTLMLADEPTSSLDDDNAARVIELLKSLSEEFGSTMLVASHDSRVTSYFSKSLTLEKVQEQSR